MDAQCDAANGLEGGHFAVQTCTVFKGKAQTCKRIGGLITWVDCCNTPTSVSLGAYIDLLTNVSQLDNAIQGLDATNAVRAGYETLRDPIVSTWSEVTKPFVDVYSDIAADVFGSASDIAKEGLVDGLKTMLMKEVATWVGETFGAAAGNLLFSTAGSGAAAYDSTGALSAEASSSGVQLGGGGAVIGTALSVIMIAYTIYVIIQILTSIIWECEQSEYELAAKKSLRSCVYLGTWCTGHKEWNLCIGEKESYCCFSSPLARILQEQIRPQLGMSFGDKKDPRLQGDTHRELGPRGLEQGRPGRMDRHPQGNRPAAHRRQRRPEAQLGPTDGPGQPLQRGWHPLEHAGAQYPAPGSAGRADHPQSGRVAGVVAGAETMTD
jgi:conjugal transfer mating pair stabilization protein TraN